MHERMYVGSTSNKITTREDNRSRKHDSVAAQKLVNAEPAIHYWHITGTYWEFVPLKVRHARDIGELHMIEQSDLPQRALHLQALQRGHWSHLPAPGHRQRQRVCQQTTCSTSTTSTSQDIHMEISKGPR